MPYALFPIPYSLFPIPYSLFPIPYSLFPIVPHVTEKGYIFLEPVYLQLFIDRNCLSYRFLW
jgi:hypothetical protein